MCAGWHRIMITIMAVKVTTSPLETNPRSPVREGRVVEAIGGSCWTRREIEALVRVSRAEALSTKSADVLEVIAQEACRVTRAKSASILLSQPGSRFALAAACGLSDEYELFLRGGS